MGNEENIPAHIKRFILTSIDSVPHLEAMLLLHADQQTAWDAKAMAQRLYTNDQKAGDLLSDLCKAGFAVAQSAGRYSYGPISSELREKIDQLCEVYSKRLLEVTALIHSKTNKNAQQFGDAFKWQNE